MNPGDELPNGPRPQIKTAEELLKWLGDLIDDAEPHEVALWLDSDEPPLVLDVREREEMEGGHLPGAQHIPRSFLELQIGSLAPDRRRRIVTYCAKGARSLFAAKSLVDQGYEDVVTLRGGFQAWREKGHPVVKPRALSDAERRRYQRHLLIPEVGEEGQGRLLQAKVLLVGAGGLGSPAALYLAAAGVGTLGIIDDDVVDESNLQRQILHPSDRVGMKKVESARRSMAAINPGISIRTHQLRLTSSNVEEIFEGYDIILDGSDNFPTRYLVNDACVLLSKPCVHGSVYRFQGQVSVFCASGGPCYRCLYPAPPPPELSPSCAEAGVLGVLPGVVGLLEAVEVVKLILGKGDVLVGRLLHYDALAARFREFRLKANPKCPVCAEGVEFPGFCDYEQFCSSSHE